MAYKIQYTPEDAKRYPKVKKRIQLQWGSFIPFVFLAAGILWLRLNGIPDWLIPGDAQVTRAAATAMVSGLREGVGAKEAITTFCHEILHGAGF